MEIIEIVIRGKQTALKGRILTRFYYGWILMDHDKT